jgi:16S rRNA processing protein RimM
MTRNLTPPPNNAITPTPPSDLLIIGKLGAAHGIQGWLKIHSFTVPIANIFLYQPWWLQDANGCGPVTVAEHRTHGQGLVLRIEGCDDRNTACLYTGATIAVSRQLLPALPADQYYWADLEGLRVETVDHRVLGTVDHLLSTHANDVLVVKGERERWIPFLRPHVVKHIDLANKILIVDWDSDF